MGFFHKMPGGYILLQIIKEPWGLIYNLLTGQMAELIVNVITMCPLISVWSKRWVIFKKAHFLPTGLIVIKLFYISQ